MPGIHTVGTLSGGAGSWGACRRWIDRNGRDGMVLLFTDVAKPGDPFTGEDEDTRRFLGDAAGDLGVPLVTVQDGRSIWDVFAEKRWLGNASLAHCSWELKTGPARQWIERNAPDAERIIVGIDVTEIHRLDSIRDAWAPLHVVAPLLDKPMLWKPQLQLMLSERGMPPPRMYAMGFSHANCPACVKGGQKHWLRLLRTWPDRYAYAEQREAGLRAELGDVSILKDRSGGRARPLTLERFRRRVEAGEQLSLLDEVDGEGGCGCFLSDPGEGL
jgi:hypothetical protein